MSFSNAPRYAPETAAAYVSALLELLGEQDPVAVMRETPEAVRRAASGMTEDELRIPEARDKWSVLQVVRHLADSELVYGYRMRLIVAENQPGIPSYDQNAWATNLLYNEGTLQDALADLSAMRAMNLRWLDRLDEEVLDRWGMHAERGKESVRHIVRLLAAHDLVHLNQIARIKAALSA